MYLAIRLHTAANTKWQVFRRATDRRDGLRMTGDATNHHGVVASWLLPAGAMGHCFLVSWRPSLTFPSTCSSPMLFPVAYSFTKSLQPSPSADGETRPSGVKSRTYGLLPYTTPLSLLDTYIIMPFDLWFSLVQSDVDAPLLFRSSRVHNLFRLSVITSTSSTLVPPHCAPLAFHFFSPTTFRAPRCVSLISPPESYPKKKKARLTPFRGNIRLPTADSRS